MSRLSLKTVPTFLGDCYILTDNESGKNIEVMAAQLRGIARSQDSMGSLPHGGWDKENDVITIHHDDNSDNHEVTFTMKEFEELVS